MKQFLHFSCLICENLLTIEFGNSAWNQSSLILRQFGKTYEHKLMHCFYCSKQNEITVSHNITNAFIQNSQAKDVKSVCLSKFQTSCSRSGSITKNNTFPEFDTKRVIHARSSIPDYSRRRLTLGKVVLQIHSGPPGRKSRLFICGRFDLAPHQESKLQGHAIHEGILRSQIR